MLSSSITCTKDLESTCGLLVASTLTLLMGVSSVGLRGYMALQGTKFPTQAITWELHLMYPSHTTMKYSFELRRVEHLHVIRPARANLA
jgi:hypothetical protein